jgi:hypothetical protein
VSDAIEDGVEIIDWLKTNMALAEVGTRDNFRLQVIMIAKKYAFANAYFAAGSNQSLPIVGLGGELAR